MCGVLIGLQTISIRHTQKRGFGVVMTATYGHTFATIRHMDRVITFDLLKVTRIPAISTPLVDIASAIEDSKGRHTFGTMPDLCDSALKHPKIPMCT
tara:strand:+ start:423 stop:713 length:291 start_codon:yes stop_codon:yes gene_type:complete